MKKEETFEMLNELNKTIRYLEKRKRELKKEIEKVMAAIRKKMESDKTFIYTTEKFVCRLKRGDVKKRFDIVNFRENNPDLYDKYRKFDHVKRFDYKALLKDHPDICDEYTTVEIVGEKIELTSAEDYFLKTQLQ